MALPMRMRSMLIPLPSNTAQERRERCSSYCLLSGLHMEGSGLTSEGPKRLLMTSPFKTIVEHI